MPIVTLWWQSLDWHPSLPNSGQHGCMHACAHTDTHTHLRGHISPFWRSAHKSRTPPTQTLIGSCVPVLCYISEQVLAICTVNQAHKTITDFSCTDDDTAELLISAWTAQASHTLPINIILSHCVLEKCRSASHPVRGSELRTPGSPWLLMDASPHTALSPSPLPPLFPLPRPRTALFLPQPTAS